MGESSVRADSRLVKPAPRSRTGKLSGQSGEADAGQALGGPVSADGILLLQRAAGNAAVSGWLAQREPATAAAPAQSAIDAAIASGDPAEVKRLADVGRATEEQKIKLLHILAYQSWAGIRDEWKMEEIWRSFQNDVPRVMVANRPLWDQCVKKGADLDKLPLSKSVAVHFMVDVQNTALAYLKKNREYVNKEMEDLGIGTAAPSAAQDERLRTVQQMASLVKEAQARDWELRSVKVGDEYKMPEDAIPFWMSKEFDPESPPDRNLDKDDGDRLRDWKKVKEVWDPVANFVTTVSNQYPSIYATVAQSERWVGGDDKVAALADEKDPEKARALIGASLKLVLKNIADSEVKIPGNKPDYRDLLPIHAQLFDGTAASPSGTDWSLEFNHWVVDKDREDYKTRQWWTELGYNTAAAAAFVVVELATFGSATFFIAAGVGLAATGIKAASSLDQYLTLKTAAESTVKDQTSLVDKATVAEAGKKAIEDAVKFLAMVGAVGLKVIQGIRNRQAPAAPAQAQTLDQEIRANGQQVRGRFPDRAAPNQTLYRVDPNTGNITYYQTYDAAGLPLKRVDLVGATHGGIPTPHVQEYTRNVNPQGQTFVNKGPVRPARPDEIP